MFVPMGMQQPMMMMAPGPMMQPMVPQQQQTPHEIPQFDELNLLDQELNMTRRATRPFVPSNIQDNWQLQNMEELPVVKIPSEPITSADQLPPPKRTIKSSQNEGPKSSSRPEVRIADQIAIRSFVLSKEIGKIGGNKSAE